MEGHQALEEFCEIPQGGGACSVSVMLFSFGSSVNLLNRFTDLPDYVSGRKFPN